MYPRGAFSINGFPVVPGDTISAEVKFQGRGTYLLTISNVTRDATYSTKQRLNSAKNGSAEWIVEAPWSGGVLPLADFGTIQLSACSATIDGHTGPLGDWSSSADAITMASGSTTKATPSSLTTSDSFSVTWSHE